MNFHSVTARFKRILMELNLLSCDTPRPDRRAIANCIAEISSDSDVSLANELTDMFLEGDVITLELGNINTDTALRALRKLSIDYEIIE